jgi:DNA-binding HxlR family transcriptional regulator
MDKFKPLDTFLNVIKGKGKTPILVLIGKKPYRYSELRKRFPTLSERILIKQLKELERDGVIVRKVIGDKPPLHVEYALSEYGSTLCTVMQQMWQWGEEHMTKK